MPALQGVSVAMGMLMLVPLWMWLLDGGLCWDMCTLMPYFYLFCIFLLWFMHKQSKGRKEESRIEYPPKSIGIKEGIVFDFLSLSPSV